MSNLNNQEIVGKLHQPKEGGLMARRESDHIIVLGDGKADHMGKGVTELCSPQRKQKTDKKGRVYLPTSLWGIANRAKLYKKYKFGNLYSLLNESNLRICFYELKKNAAPGVDDVVFKDYEEDLSQNISVLVGKLKSKSYRAKLIRRKYIPKSPGKFRALGIPVLEDKLIQLCVTKILTAIYEQDFLVCSYGYREKLGPAIAVEELTFNLQFGSYGWIVEADIQGFFDNINHDWMIRMLQERIDDKGLLILIRRWLKAGILEEDGKIISPVTGTPQGGIISPVLANIYLHYVLDLWFDRRVKVQSKGMAMIVRYADDYVCAFQYKSDAESFFQEMGSRLEKFNLKVAPEKTNLIPFSRFKLSNAKSFDFLSFEFRWKLNYKGVVQVKRRTSPKKLKSSIQKFGEWIKENRDKGITSIFKTLKLKYQGYWNYYGIHDNGKSIGSYYYHTVALLFKWLNRRSQRKSYNWKGLTELLKWFKIPRPKIKQRISRFRSNILSKPLSA